MVDNIDWTFILYLIIEFFILFFQKTKQRKQTNLPTWFLLLSSSIITMINHYGQGNFNQLFIDHFNICYLSTKKKTFDDSFFFLFVYFVDSLRTDGQQQLEMTGTGACFLSKKYRCRSNSLWSEMIEIRLSPDYYHQLAQTMLILHFFSYFFLL